MQDFVPYLQFNGNAKEAMNFYRKVLGGEFTGYATYGEVPGGEKMAAEDQEKFIHIALTTSNGNRIMATDKVSGMGMDLITGNNLHICIQTDSAAEADQFFEGLADGGTIMMPMNQTFWGDYFGMCTDKFGTHWMINHAAGK